MDGWDTGKPDSRDGFVLSAEHRDGGCVSGNIIWTFRVVYMDGESSLSRCVTVSLCPVSSVLAVFDATVSLRHCLLISPGERNHQRCRAQELAQIARLSGESEEAEHIGDHYLHVRVLMLCAGLPRGTADE